MMRYFIILMLALGSCATKQPKIDRVQKVPIYVTIPDEILARCPDAPRIDEADIVTETDYNEKFVLPLWEAHFLCHKSIKDVITINEDAKLRNNENEHLSE